MVKSVGKVLVVEIALVDAVVVLDERVCSCLLCVSRDVVGSEKGCGSGEMLCVAGW
jgi:hypothetical protein